MGKSKVVLLKSAQAPVETPFYEKHWFKVFARFVSKFIGSIPPLKRYISKTVPYLNGRVPKVYREGNYVEALDLSLLGLIKCDTNNELDHYWWWSFMGYAVYCVYMLNKPHFMNKLMSIAEKGPQPFEGSSSAYCFCNFSDFKFAEGDYDLAISLAERAKNADDTSGEAYYLLGYYELFINEKDPVELFSAAIERDHKILGRIIHHPSLKEFPGIIEELKKLHLVPPKQSPNKALKSHAVNRAR